MLALCPHQCLNKGGWQRSLLGLFVINQLTVKLLLTLDIIWAGILHRGSQLTNFKPDSPHSMWTCCHFWKNSTKAVYWGLSRPGLIMRVDYSWLRERPQLKWEVMSTSARNKLNLKSWDCGCFDRPPMQLDFSWLYQPGLCVCAWVRAGQGVCDEWFRHLSIM